MTLSADQLHARLQSKLADLDATEASELTSMRAHHTAALNRLLAEQADAISALRSRYEAYRNAARRRSAEASDRAQARERERSGANLLAQQAAVESLNASLNALLTNRAAPEDVAAALEVLRQETSALTPANSNAAQRASVAATLAMFEELVAQRLARHASRG